MERRRCAAAAHQMQPKVRFEPRRKGVFRPNGQPCAPSLWSAVFAGCQLGNSVQHRPRSTKETEAAQHELVLGDFVNLLRND